MANTVYEVEKKTVDGTLILFLVFLGWFGIDKFYATKSFGKGWKLALVKFAYNLIGLGILWNIFDIIQAIRCKYEIDFREYFR